MVVDIAVWLSSNCILIKYVVGIAWFLYSQHKLMMPVGLLTMAPWAFLVDVFTTNANEWSM